MKPKRAFFLKGDQVVEYRARTDTTGSPVAIGDLWPGLAREGFGSDVDAALTAGNGFVYFFQGDSYVRLDPRTRQVDVPRTPIATGWPNLVPSGFHVGVDAAVYYRDRKVLFFRGPQYLRYDIDDDQVDPGYPKQISAGWSNIAAPFTDGIDAAVNWGEGVVYLFRGGKYVRITVATNAVDAGYPLDTGEQWPALPAAFTDNPSDAVEWPYCEVAQFDVRLSPDGCQTSPVDPDAVVPLIRAQQLFVMVAQFSAPEHPAACGCGEYRQFVRGSWTVDGVSRPTTLADGSTVPPRPVPPTPDGNFREDSMPRAAAGANLHYGHRDEQPGNADASDHYDPDRATGCVYRGSDHPFVDGSPGQSYTMDLDFKGVLIDRCDDDAQLDRRDWQVFCSGTFS